MSGVIVGSGKSYEHLNHRRVKMEQVRRDMGEPAYQNSYNPPVAVKMTPEFIALTKKKGLVFVHGDGDRCESEIASYCDVFTRTGPFAKMLRGEGYGMASGLTFGVADVVLLPNAIKERSELGKEQFSITFWYDKDKRVIGLYEGDVRTGKGW